MDNNQSQSLGAAVLTDNGWVLSSKLPAETETGEGQRIYLRAEQLNGIVTEFSAGPDLADGKIGSSTVTFVCHPNDSYDPGCDDAPECARLEEHIAYVSGAIGNSPDEENAISVARRGLWDFHIAKADEADEILPLWEDLQTLDRMGVRMNDAVTTP